MATQAWLNHGPRSYRSIQEKQLSDEISAYAVLAQALLDLGKLSEANLEITQAKHLSNKAESRGARFSTEVVAAKLLAQTNPSDSVRSLKSAVEEAETSGLFIFQLEASLALGKVEMASGSKAAGRARL